MSLILGAIRSRRVQFTSPSSSLVVVAIMMMIVMSVAMIDGASQNAKALKYTQVNNVIVIMFENWSYDGLFGTYSKANGIAKASTETKTQLDMDNQAYTTLPQVQAGVPQTISNGPYDLNEYISTTTKTMDVTHAFYTHQYQMNNGKMNKYVPYSAAKGLVMSHYDLVGQGHYMAQLAQNYTLFDYWFQGAFGGSMLNHQWLITPGTPYFPNPPSSIVNTINETSGQIIYPEKAVSPDNYVVNTAYSVNKPYPVSMPPLNTLVPSQNGTTIGDLLTNASISWKWYSGGYNDAMNGNPDPSWQAHHQPFVFFKNYEVGTEGRNHLKDETDLFSDLKNNQLPSVTFYKPLGKDNMHPGYSTVAGSSEDKLKEVIEAVKASKYWNNCLIFITFDEYGGRWDHVAPPKVDKWGPGTRIPTIAVSPLVKKGNVNSIYHDTTSIMKFIQDRFGLPSISTRDAAQLPLDDIFLPTVQPSSMKSNANTLVVNIFTFVCVVISLLVNF